MLIGRTRQGWLYLGQLGAPAGTGGIDGQGASLLSLENGFDEATGLGSAGFSYIQSFQHCQEGACKPA
jgi:hypothetical protein